MTNRPDLIEQLSKLTPTEGEWVAELQKDNIYYLLNEDTELMLLDKDWCMKAEDNSKLITLAPAMRIEILAMAKEIEELKEELTMHTRKSDDNYTDHFLEWRNRFFDFKIKVLEYKSKSKENYYYSIDEIHKKYELAMKESPFKH